MPRPLTTLCLLLAVLLAVLLASPAVGSFPASASLAAATDPVGVWPLTPEPEVVARFDPPDDPYGAGHRGVDLLGSVGQPVRAALPGTISFTGSIAGRGVVVVDHGATRTTYEPVTAALPVGTVVAAGTTIGSLQAGGGHCPPRTCLHWGWIEGKTYLHPLRLVGAGPVRLLPLWSAPAAPAGAPLAAGGVPVAAGGPLGRSSAPVTLATSPNDLPSACCVGSGQARGWAWR